MLLSKRADIRLRHPPCDCPSHLDFKCTALRIRRDPVFPIVSQVLSALLNTLNCFPQYFSISGINGSWSSRPFSSRVRRISSLLRTSTSSPTRRPSANFFGRLVSHLRYFPFNAHAWLIGFFRVQPAPAKNGPIFNSSKRRLCSHHMRRITKAD